jgi:hypothetical protein
MNASYAVTTLRREADEIIAEYPETSLVELAGALERTVYAFDGGTEFGRMLAAELRRRAMAGVRIWNGPRLVSDRP